MVKKTFGYTAVWWVCAVYLLSFGCYVPMLLERMGTRVPAILLSLRFFYVLTPALAAIAFSAREHRLKAFLSSQFKRVSLREAALCMAAALAGLLTALCCSFAGVGNSFAAVYPTALSFTGSAVYLFATALAEELAWRGFLLARLADRCGQLAASLAAGVVWAVWHVPMWSIRNSLGLEDIIPLLLWAVLLSVPLGMLYCSFHNILSAALLHMVFNLFFLAPISYNCAVIVLSGILLFALYKRGIVTV